jgi:hypothetical protein
MKAISRLIIVIRNIAQVALQVLVGVVSSGQNPRDETHITEPQLNDLAVDETAVQHVLPQIANSRGKVSVSNLGTVSRGWLVVLIDDRKTQIGMYESFCFLGNLYELIDKVFEASQRDNVPWIVETDEANRTIYLKAQNRFHI